MGIQTVPPALGSYSHVLIRTDRDADPTQAVPMRVACYHENTTSRSIPWKGGRVHAVFLRTEEAARRAWRLGWTRITEEWFHHLEELNPRPTTQSQESILAALTPEWKSKAEILEDSGVADTEWRTAIRYLLEKGLAESNATRRTTNRGHRYRLPVGR